MPRPDNCHDAIVNAFKKEGWSIDTDFYIVSETRSAYIDVQATRGVNGQRETVLLAEIKCFAQNTNQELYEAIGQYVVYRLILAETQNLTPLYLAVPQSAYQQTFDKIALRAMAINRVKMVIVDVDHEAIVQWINP
jgi:hypothetical protein